MDKLLFILIILVSCLFVAQYSSLHNVDLSCYDKHIDMVDDNGLIVQGLQDMYDRSMLILWAIPFLFTVGFSCII